MLECPECNYSTETGRLFLDHLLTYHPDKAREIFVKFIDEGKIKIEVA